MRVRFVAALLLAGLAAGCGNKPGGAGPAAMIVQVVGFQSKQQPIQDKISLVGTLQANEAVEIKAEIDGTIDEIGFEEGQRVSKGQMLLRIDRVKLEAMLAEAEANLKLADANRKRYQALSETRAVSQQEVDQAVAAFEVGRSAVHLAKARLEDAVIAAPFDGVTGARSVSVGQFIAQGTPLTTLINSDPMKAEFHVPERYLAQIRDGQTVEVAVAAYPEDRFAGQVYFVSPQVDEATRTVLVKARIPNPDGRLRRGMFANLDLIVRVREQAIVVPEGALMLKGDAASIFVIGQNDIAEIRPVETGVRLAGWVEIASGLSEGETVVIEGTQKLWPGAKVKVALR